MTRYIKRGGQVWIKIFPDKPITEKPAETRMGSGKGSPEYWVAVVKPTALCLRSAASARSWQERLCVSPLTSCPSSANSLSRKKRGVKSNEGCWRLGNFRLQS